MVLWVKRRGVGVVCVCGWHDCVACVCCSGWRLNRRCVFPVAKAPRPRRHPRPQRNTRPQRRVVSGRRGARDAAARGPGGVADGVVHLCPSPHRTDARTCRCQQKEYEHSCLQRCAWRSGGRKTLIKNSGGSHRATAEASCVCVRFLLPVVGQSAAQKFRAAPGPSPERAETPSGRCR